VTGWIDAVSNRINPGEHSIAIRGRSKCSDLVDCSAEFPPDQSQPGGVPKLVHYNKTVVQVATELCIPYGITVRSISPDEVTTMAGLTGIPAMEQLPADVIRQFDVNVGETAYAIIERLARSQGLLVMDNFNGELVLLPPALPATMNSGILLGENILAMSFDLDFSQRYSEIDVFDQTVNSQGEQGTTNLYGKALDAGIARHRRYMGFSEAPYVSTQVWTQRRADWERNRRVGRSQVLHVSVDSWWDSGGYLWTPNLFVTVHAPQMGVENAAWVVSEVTFSQDTQSGTTAQLTLMPKIAFSVEPTTVVKLDPALNLGANNTGVIPGGAPT
jgi:prophage tail gpP-like protein